MRKLTKPTEDIALTFAACINTTFDDADLKKRLSGIFRIIKVASDDYDRKGETSLLHTIVPSATVGMVSKNEMKTLYNYRFVQHDEGRKIYDRMMLVPFGRCPLCNQRRVSTLDHYLPISDFPVFAITPFNLVPACFECNKKKLAKSSTVRSKTSLHPYYDDIENDDWLEASVILGEPIILQYKVTAPKSWDDELKARVEHHFSILGLEELYGLHAAEEVTTIGSAMKRIYDAGGPSEVKKDLFDSFNLRYQSNRNSWQTAMFKALANSNAYHHSFG